MSLAVENLRKTFGDKVAVDNLNIHMDAPGVFGLIGTNGAGKTTSIRTILGVMRKDSGVAKWKGKDISKETVRYGYMPEERGIYPKHKTAHQLIYFGMLRGMTKSAAQRSVSDWLKRLQIDEYADVQAEKLSKGNQQKVQLIATLVHDPELLFLDEPFSGMDPVNADIFKSVIHDLARAGKYIIMSSHQMSTVEEHCSDIVLMDRGKVLLAGNLAEIKARRGYTRVQVRGDERIAAIANELGLPQVEDVHDGRTYGITGSRQAEEFFGSIAREGIVPLKFEICQPSLNEIFLEKVGENK